MRKIIVVLGICVILTSMPLIAASPGSILNKVLPRIGSTEGTFEGVFAEKDEYGYNILGNVSGSYSVSSRSWGTMSGTWETLDGNVSGDFSGYIWGRLFLGQYDITGSEDEGHYIGLFRVNETTSEFKAISLVFPGDDYLVRYALGDVEES